MVLRVRSSVRRLLLEYGLREVRINWPQFLAVEIRAVRSYTTLGPDSGT